MKNYSSYKNTGVDWLEFIPSHWSLRKMKYTFDEKSDKGYASLPLLSATQNQGVIKKSEYENRTVEATKSLETLKLVEVGDFVISLRSFQGGIEYSYERGIISPAYTILRPTHILASYFKYLGKSPAFIQLLKSMVTGIREGQNIDYSKLRENLLPIPPKKEQEVIASYLDAATAKIDEAIAQQQRMIDLLNERKQIIIDQAVSRGVSSVGHAPVLKDSGYDWLGQIPAHWDINKLKYLCKMFGRIGFRGYSAEDLVEEGEGAVTLSPTNIIEGKLDFTECSYLSWQKYYESPEIMVFPGDVIFVKTASIGKTAYVESIPLETTVNPQILVLKDIIPNSEYLSFYLQSSFMQGWVKATANGSTILTIPQTTIGNYPIALPSPDEQVAIVDYLKQEIGKIERAKASVNNTINLLQERKQIIINDIVIGKVKV